MRIIARLPAMDSLLIMNEQWIVAAIATVSLTTLEKHVDADVEEAEVLQIIRPVPYFHGTRLSDQSSSCF
jgi:hypothetical protein